MGCVNSSHFVCHGAVLIAFGLGTTLASLSPLFAATGGAIAGIVIACIVILLLLVVIHAWLLRRDRRAGAADLQRGSRPVNHAAPPTAARNTTSLAPEATPFTATALQRSPDADKQHARDDAESPVISEGVADLELAYGDFTDRRHSPALPADHHRARTPAADAAAAAAYADFTSDTQGGASQGLPAPASLSCPIDYVRHSNGGMRPVPPAPGGGSGPYDAYLQASSPTRQAL
jgi:hypothetical protein